MRYMILLIVFFVIFIPNQLFSMTTSDGFSKIDGWDIKIEHSRPMQSRWCRATKTFDSNDITILLGELIPQYGRMLFSITMHDRRLPSKYNGEVKLVIDKEIFASGNIVSVGNWEGGKRTAHYARATFKKIEDAKHKLQHGHEFAITGDEKLFKPLTLELDLKPVLSELQRCLHSKYPRKQ